MYGRGAGYGDGGDDDESAVMGPSMGAVLDPPPVITMFVDQVRH